MSSPKKNMPTKDELHCLEHLIFMVTLLLTGRNMVLYKSLFKRFVESEMSRA